MIVTLHFLSETMGTVTYHKATGRIEYGGPNVRDVRAIVRYCLAVGVAEHAVPTLLMERLHGYTWASSDSE